MTNDRMTKGTARAPQRSSFVIRASSFAGTLCPQCALCCNGVLFADVRLQKGDSADKLLALGVPLRVTEKGARFRQPCACLEANRCRIYEDRPARCRAFDCRLLQRANAGELSPTSALRTIAVAKRRVEEVRHLLRELGDTDESVPLSRRYQRMVREPMDLSQPRRCRLQERLMRAVGELAQVLEEKFL